jgi:hypothetical protein
MAGCSGGASGPLRPGLKPYRSPHRARLETTGIGDTGHLDDYRELGPEELLICGGGPAARVIECPLLTDANSGGQHDCDLEHKRGSHWLVAISRRST